MQMLQPIAVAVPVRPLVPADVATTAFAKALSVVSNKADYGCRIDAYEAFAGTPLEQALCDDAAARFVERQEHESPAIQVIKTSVEPPVARVTQEAPFDPVPPNAGHLLRIAPGPATKTVRFDEDNLASSRQEAAELRADLKEARRREKLSAVGKVVDRVWRAIR